MGNKTNIQDLTNKELSLIVFNDDFLYRKRRDITELMEYITMYYIYTLDQLKELVSDIEYNLKDEK